MLLVLLHIIITVISVMALGPRGSNRGYEKGSSSRYSSSSLLCSDVRLWTVVLLGCCKVLECEQSVLGRSCRHISDRTAL